MTDTTNRNRRQLIGMVTIALLTMGGAYALFYAVREGGVWGTTNNGTFVIPPTTAAQLGLRRPDGRVLSEGETWWLWVVAPSGCGSECEAAIYQLRQLHVLLNKDADRVRRALVTDSGHAPPVLDEYPKLIHLTGATDLIESGIYIVDPIGNLVLHYPLADAGKPVLQDLKKLLKLSQIG